MACFNKPSPREDREQIRLSMTQVIVKEEGLNAGMRPKLHINNKQSVNLLETFFSPKCVKIYYCMQDVLTFGVFINLLVDIASRLGDFATTGGI